MCVNLWPLRRVGRPLPRSGGGSGRGSSSPAIWQIPTFGRKRRAFGQLRRTSGQEMPGLGKPGGLPAGAGAASAKLREGLAGVGGPLAGPGRWLGRPAGGSPEPAEDRLEIWNARRYSRKARRRWGSAGRSRPKTGWRSGKARRRWRKARQSRRTAGKCWGNAGRCWGNVNRGRPKAGAGPRELGAVKLEEPPSPSLPRCAGEGAPARLGGHKLTHMGAGGEGRSRLAARATGTAEADVRAPTRRPGPDPV